LKQSFYKLIILFTIAQETEIPQLGKGGSH